MPLIVVEDAKRSMGPASPAQNPSVSTAVVQVAKEGDALVASLEIAVRRRGFVEEMTRTAAMGVKLDSELVERTLQMS
jgi:hypothetical protein